MAEQIVTHKVTGLAELERGLMQLPNELSERVLLGAVMQGAEPIREFASRLAPIRTDEYAKAIGRSRKGAKYARLAGFLRANIVKKRVNRSDRDSVSVGIGPSKKAFYGMFVELGTRYVRARPFLRPALELMYDKGIVRMKEVLAPAIERALARYLRKASRTN